MYLGDQQELKQSLLPSDPCNIDANPAWSIKLLNMVALTSVSLSYKLTAWHRDTTLEINTKTCIFVCTNKLSNELDTFKSFEMFSCVNSQFIDPAKMLKNNEN